MSAVDLLSDYEPATEVPTILANCGQQRDVLRPLRVRAVRAASLSRRNIKVGCGSWLRENADVLRCRRMVFSRVRCSSPLARSSPLGAHRMEVQKSRQFRDSRASGTRLTYHLSCYHVSCREVIWWRVGIRFQRFLIRTRFHAPNHRTSSKAGMMWTRSARPQCVPSTPRADGFDAARKSFGVVPEPEVSILHIPLESPAPSGGVEYHAKLPWCALSAAPVRAPR